jgi:single-strand DNA-binding protein
MNLTGLIRLGRDAEIRYTNDGTPVASLSAAWNYGKKDPGTGQRPTQWADLSLWGDRATKLEQYLTKGAQFYVVCSEAHIETFDRRDGGQGAKLVGRIEQLEFAGGRREEGGQGQGAAPAQAPAARPGPPVPPRTASRAPAPPAQRQVAGSGFDDMDDDIPF